VDDKDSEGKIERQQTSETRQTCEKSEFKANMMANGLMNRESKRRELINDNQTGFQSL
jgi:hypothetical protein